MVEEYSISQMAKSSKAHGVKARSTDSVIFKSMAKS